MNTRKYLFTIVGGSVLINPVFAQEQTPDVVDEVIVTGLRASLESAQTIKLESDTFVDSITATDRRLRKVFTHVIKMRNR